MSQKYQNCAQAKNRFPGHSNTFYARNVKQKSRLLTPVDSFFPGNGGVRSFSRQTQFTIPSRAKSILFMYQNRFRALLKKKGKSNKHEKRSNKTQQKSYSRLKKIILLQIAPKIYRPMRGELLQQLQSFREANSVLVWDKKPIMDWAKAFKSTKI